MKKGKSWGRESVGRRVQEWGESDGSGDGWEGGVRGITTGASPPTSSVPVLQRPYSKNTFEWREALNVRGPSPVPRVFRQRVRSDSGGRGRDEFQIEPRERTKDTNAPRNQRA